MPINEIIFPLCRVTDSLWNRKVVSLLSSLMTMVRLPTSCTSSMACWLRCFNDNWETMCVFASSWQYCLAAAPCLAAVELRMMGLSGKRKYQEQWRLKPSISLWPRVLELHYYYYYYYYFTLGKNSRGRKILSYARCKLIILYNCITHYY